MRFLIRMMWGLFAACPLLYSVQTMGHMTYAWGTPYFEGRITYYAWDVRITDFFWDKNPCYKVSNCYIVYGELFDSSRFASFARVPKLATNAETFGDFWEGAHTSPDYFFKGLSYDPNNNPFPNGVICVDLGYQIGSAAPIRISSSSCDRLTPPPVSCSISNETIVLQHPTLNASELMGNVKESSVNVTCTRSASVKLAMTGLKNNSQLSLSNTGSLYSTLRLNGTLAATGIRLNNVSTGGKQVTISSVLGTNGVVAGGAYSGSAVLVLSVL
ncbi:hypothetical protein V6301_07930 [Serratia marcescens]|uniref:MrpH family fimbial adhesin n=1 Tax=Serratia TaxID=613 RepID=UPI000AA752BB|nr:MULTISPECIES: hypothetical protein [Serratia]MBN5225170.1 hypothetical protein [Serratia ureilytica]